MNEIQVLFLKSSQLGDLRQSTKYSGEGHLEPWVEGQEVTPVPSLSWSDEKKPGKMGTFWVLKVSYWLKHGESKTERWEGMAQDADLSSESCRGDRGTGQCQEQARRG